MSCATVGAPCLSRPPQGAPGTPYAGGIFCVSLVVPESYPLSPPAVKFVTKVFHPNVHWKARRCGGAGAGSESSLLAPQTGEICLDILKSAWSPAWTLQSVCRAILSLLSHPAPDSPLNCDAGNLLRAGDTLGFNSMARCYTIEHAKQKR